MASPPAPPARRAGRALRRASAFTMLELQVSLGVMAVGLLGIGTLMLRQSRQIRHLERWCEPSPTYHVITQTDPWMRAIGAPAGLETEAGHTAWTPSVSAGRDAHLLIESLSRSNTGMEMSATVKVYNDGNRPGRWWAGPAQAWQIRLDE